MKKIVTLCLAVLAACTFVNAQTVENSKLSDNWFIGLDGGIYSKVTKPGRAVRPVVGVSIGRYLTPVFGLRANGQFYINGKFMNNELGIKTGKASKTVFDYDAVTLDGLFNLNNLFCGYKGTPDPVEVVAVAGLGWYHGNGDATYRFNKAMMKIGAQLNFNLGKSKAWQVNIEPDLCYYAGASDGDAILNINRSFAQITGGITYKFGCSNGTHNFVLAKPYNQAEIDALNSKVNSLRSTVDEKDKTINNDQQQIDDLKAKLADCESTPKTTVTNKTENTTLAPVVIFDQGKAVINPAQAPSVSMIATYMKNHPHNNVIIKGYASPEGKAEVNQKLSLARANAVKNMLVKKYKISAKRLSVEGMGATNDVFSEADWNRVCTFIETK
jgi:outer membrane protein OmpA-like peptidoglycan-associated protein